jgi:hypothetical protein
MWALGGHKQETLGSRLPATELMHRGSSSIIVWAEPERFTHYYGNMESKRSCNVIVGEYLLRCDADGFLLAPASYCTQYS